MRRVLSATGDRELTGCMMRQASSNAFCGLQECLRLQAVASSLAKTLVTPSRLHTAAPRCRQAHSSPNPKRLTIQLPRTPSSVGRCQCPVRHQVRLPSSPCHERSAWRSFTREKHLVQQCQSKQLYEAGNSTGSNFVGLEELTPKLCLHLRLQRHDRPEKNIA